MNHEHRILDRRLSPAKMASRYLPEDMACSEASVGGLRLLEIMAGYERVILVDAIQTPRGQARRYPLSAPERSADLPSR